MYLVSSADHKSLHIDESSQCSHKHVPSLMIYYLLIVTIYLKARPLAELVYVFIHTVVLYYE